MTLVVLTQIVTLDPGGEGVFGARLHLDGELVVFTLGHLGGVEVQALAALGSGLIGDHLGILQEGGGVPLSTAGGLEAAVLNQVDGIVLGTVHAGTEGQQTGLLRLLLLIEDGSHLIDAGGIVQRGSLVGHLVGLVRTRQVVGGGGGGVLAVAHGDAIAIAGAGGGGILVGTLTLIDHRGKVGGLQHGLPALAAVVGTLDLQLGGVTGGNPLHQTGALVGVHHGGVEGNLLALILGAVLVDVIAGQSHRLLKVGVALGGLVQHIVGGIGGLGNPAPLEAALVALFHEVLAEGLQILGKLLVGNLGIAADVVLGEDDVRIGEEGIGVGHVTGAGVMVVTHQIQTKAGIGHLVAIIGGYGTGDVG